MWSLSNFALLSKLFNFFLFLNLVCISNQKSFDSNFYYEEGYHLIQKSIDTSADRLLCTQIESQAKKLLLSNTSSQLSSQLKNQFSNEIIRKTTFILSRLDQISTKTDITRQKRGFAVLGEMWHDISDSPGPVQYMIEQNQMRQIQSTLTSQVKLDSELNSDINKLKTVSNSYEKEISKIENIMASLVLNDTLRTSDKKTIFTLLIFRFNVMEELDSCEHRIIDYHTITNEACNKRLSPLLINSTTLKQEISKIETDNAILQPFFRSQNHEQYYFLETTKLIKQGHKLHFFIRIPLIDKTHVQTIKKLDYVRKTEFDHIFDYLLTDYPSTFYSTITHKELETSIHIQNEGYLSQNRLIKIKIGNNFKNKIYEDITQIDTETFNMQLTNDTIATLLCPNENRKLKLTKKGTLNLPADCSLGTDLFFISSQMLTGRDNLSRKNKYASFLKRERANFADLTSILSKKNSLTVASEIQTLNLSMTEITDDLLLNISDHSDEISKLSNITSHFYLEHTVNYIASQANWDSVKMSGLFGFSLTTIAIACAAVLAAYCYCKLTNKSNKTRNDIRIDIEGTKKENIDSTSTITSQITEINRKLEQKFEAEKEARKQELIQFMQTDWSDSIDLLLEKRIKEIEDKFHRRKLGLND